MDRARSGSLLRSMRKAHLLGPVAHGWGESRAYENLMQSPKSLTLLDFPLNRPPSEIRGRVRVLSRLGPVTALIPAGYDPVPILNAGALDVLRRDGTVEELAAKLKANQRWAATASFPAPSGQRDLTASMPKHRTQRVLLQVLLHSPAPWCCHELSLLLGSGNQPLSRPALRARIERLQPHLSRHGLVIATSGRWQRIAYSLLSRTTSRPSVQ